MALRTKPPKFEDDEVVVAVTSFAFGNQVVTTGTRLRGSDPTVRQWPDAFVRDGTPKSEWPRFAPPVFDHPPEFHRVADPIPDEEAAVCTVAFSKGRDSVAKGERRRWDDELVQATRDFWRMAPLPVPEA
jgi:hypothetical protein